ncbi:sulfatase [Luteolibacter yonseiensis]|uniref:Sulfatase n=1 Tax=Luteolibacter yonseiensis TaxID=1144680 RepID=A0A934VCA7_9BACT|nr:sulfatase [Luteolibacter yonseiensis]MBK1816965.1 sulfatase [Luteolibacter yonseiensis]
MHPSTSKPPSPAAGFLPVLGGASIFLAFQYAVSLWRLTHSSGEMENKFSALAKDQYMGFLVQQNAQMLIAYGVLAAAAAFVLQPFVSLWTGRSKYRSRSAVVLRAIALTTLLHGYFTLRLVDTRPYFLSEAEFGQWYYQILNLIPAAVKPGSLFVLFTLLPCAILLYVLIWQIRLRGRLGKIAAAAACTALILTAAFGYLRTSGGPAPKTTANGRPMNVIIIGSDSLRGDAIGASGYVPARNDGLAKAGVSPTIDALAARSTRFENCYTGIASTMESGTQLMSSQYPQSHGIRQMYPNRETVAQANKRIETLPLLLGRRGYDTAAIGDWCAGYYEVVPLGMEHLSVSTFDNFKIYMSQAVVMAHFVVPLYFDNALGYRIFPQLQAFAQFVTPEVVTDRVEKRLSTVAREQKPFFWHVFYSCNHLPYRSPEPYRSMFSDPDYQGPNRNGVAFDIDSFIGGTDLESKWKALPPKEMKQIRALYDGCTRQFDDCVAKILNSLKANGLEDNTIVIVTSDHGDDQYEPGVTLGHGLTFNGGLQANHVPMIVHVPGAKPQVISETVRLIDVIPTLADFLDQPAAPSWQGKSFANWIRQTETPVHRPFYGETGFPFIQFTVPGVERPKLPPMDELTFIDPGYNYQFVVKPEYIAPLVAAKQRCLKTRYWKIVCTPTAQGTRHFALFQMKRDPYGETDIATSRPEVLAPLQAALERWMDEKEESSIAEIFPEGEPE